MGVNLWVYIYICLRHNICKQRELIQTNSISNTLLIISLLPSSLTPLPPYPAPPLLLSNNYPRSPLNQGAPDRGKNGHDVNGVLWDIVEGAEDIDDWAGMREQFRSDIMLGEGREDCVLGWRGCGRSKMMWTLTSTSPWGIYITVSGKPFLHKVM
jgi:hypothetical protein